MTLKKILPLVAVICFFSTNTFAQWTQKKGNGYYKLSAWYLEADSHYTDTGETDPNTTRGQFTVNLYGEYGLSDKIDIIAYIPFFARSFENDVISGTTGQTLSEGQAINNIGDIDLGIKYSILQGKNYAWSTSLTLGLPTGENAGGSNGSFQTGDGEFNQLIRTALGVPFSLGNLPAYAKTYVGFNNRTNNFSDEFRSGLEIGVNTLNKKLWITGKADVLKSFKNGSLSAQNSQGSIFANNIEFVSLGVETAYYLTEKLGVSLSFSNAVSGRLIYANPSFSGGVFLDIN
ncbi:hypothetical protein [Algibacter sp. L1A34]|uniref:hypothetical protein n=1 Tax=Algibacter sp. L1A34 TaxID=2686365 RepID=UPI00131EA0E7|nr:hypothetical protein [Algibacter sp. L1A34]